MPLTPPTPSPGRSLPRLQPLDVTSLRAVLAELRPQLLPARFEQAQQPTPDTLQLGLRTLEGSCWLELSWQAEAARLLAIPPPPRNGEASTLARQLQHGLRHLALVSLEQQGWERVVQLGFAERPGAALRRRLVVELMGRHSNLFLLDAETRVIAIGHQVRLGQSRRRPIGNGDPYQPPPPLSGDPPRRDEPHERWREQLTLLPLPLGEALARTYQALSPALARQLVQGMAPGDGGSDPLLQPVQTLTAVQWQELWRRWQHWLAAVEEERFHVRLTPDGGYCCWGQPASPQETARAPDASAFSGVNADLARYYGERLTARRSLQQRRQLEQRLQEASEREQRLIAMQQQRLEAAEDDAALQRQADALLCLGQPTRDQIDQAQALYRQARKLRRAREAIPALLEQAEQRLAWLEASRTFLDQAEDPAQLAALAEELEDQIQAQAGSCRRSSATRSGAERRGRRPLEAAALELISPSGLRLQVGRNHRQNEAISLRQARRGDLWFHAQECPGSHVVLKGSQAAPTREDLQAGADLAAHFSRARGNRQVPVLMVPIEQLQRIPGSAPGTVRHRGGELVWGEPERAAALLLHRQEPTASARPAAAPSLGATQSP